MVLYWSGVDRVTHIDGTGVRAGSLYTWKNGAFCDVPFEGSVLKIKSGAGGTGVYATEVFPDGREAYEDQTPWDSYVDDAGTTS